MMVASQHDRSYFATANHFIEAERNVHSSHSILIKDARLCSYYQLVLFRIAYPIIIIQILTASIDVDTFHSCMVCLYQVFMFSTQANPSERAITVVKELRSHNVFYIARPDESVFLVYTVAGDFFYSGVVDRFHKGVSIVKEIGASG